MLRIGRKIKEKKFFAGSRVGLTLIEVVLAIALLATGLVYILGAFSQCLKAHANAQKEITANYVLNNAIRDFDKCRTHTSEDTCLRFLSSPSQGFYLSRTVSQVMADFSNDNGLIQNNFYQEEFFLSWRQGKGARNISYIRYVQKKKK